MITFVTGKPGDGKTMYGMKLMVDTLLHSDRVVATNIAVKVPELRAYLILKGWKPKPGADLAERLVMLDNDDVFEFYRHRSGGYVLPPSPDWTQAREKEDEDGNKLKKLSRYQFLRKMTEQMREMKRHRRALKPMEFHIDEAHDYFSAREWTDTGRGILWYASKHRHLHDEIILYTQVMKNVEAQLRGLASFTVRARNQLRMRWGPFRKAPIFRLYHYYGGPEDTDTVQAFDTGVMQLDAKGLCATYNSAGALSVHSKPEEVKNKAPLPYWALPVMAGCAVLLLVTVMSLLPMLAGKYAGSKIKKTTEEATKAMGMPTAGITKEKGPAGLPSSKAGSIPEPEAKTSLPEQAELPQFTKVVAVMTQGETVLAFVDEFGWSPVVRSLGGGMVELANGLAVRVADLRNPRPKAVASKSGAVANLPDVRSGPAAVAAVAVAPAPVVYAQQVASTPQPQTAGPRLPPPRPLPAAQPVAPAGGTVGRVSLAQMKAGQ